MNLNFTKMHGLGNDFVVLNGLEQAIELSADQMRLLADRRFGVGCDQILLLQPSDNPDADVRYRIFNADGSEVEQCGNGARCVGDYLYKQGLVKKDVITAETAAGNIHIYIDADNAIRVNMGIPRFEPEDIPMNIENRNSEYSVDLSQGSVNFYAVSIGNPHAVIEVEHVDLSDVATIGAEMQQHSIFPNSVNVGFMQISDNNHIILRVYERGVGETLACGSGACAAVIAGIMANKLNEKVDVGLKGGHLIISWDGGNEPVWMTGPATTVYKGQIII